MQENLTASELDDIIEELGTVVSLADDADEQTPENLEVVTLGFNKFATSLLDDPLFNIDEQVCLGPTIVDKIFITIPVI